MMHNKVKIRVQTRYQPEVHAWLVKRAQRNNRSLNGELMEILKQTMQVADVDHCICMKSGVKP